MKACCWIICLKIKELAGFRESVARRPTSREGPMKDRLDAGLLDMPVSGRNLAGETLAQVLGTGLTLVVFLRHLG